MTLKMNKVFEYEICKQNDLNFIAYLSVLAGALTRSFSGVLQAFPNGCFPTFFRIKF